MPWQYDSQGWLKRQSDFCLNLAALIKYGLMMKPWDSLPSLKKRSGFTERKGLKASTVIHLHLELDQHRAFMY